MNPQRYLMPVIIAAGLHSALVYFSSDRTPPPPMTKKFVAPPLPPLPRIEMTDLVEATDEPGAGKADPVPSSEEIPRPVTTEDIFIINVTPVAEPIKPVVALPSNPSNLIGTGPMESGPGGPRLPSVINLDRVPRATVRPAPAYPAAMRTESGSVTVEFVVDTTGRVVTAEAIHWTRREFVDPAVQAVLRWRFEPGTIKGRKVNFRMVIPIEFNAA